MAGTSTERLGADEAVLTVDVEDWFHAENLGIAREMWDACESRVERNTMRMLEIFENANARATFFVLGWVAERCPHLVRAIADAGHEVASHGHGHELVYSLTPDAFRADVVRSKKFLEDLVGRPVRGYRAPCFSITDWAIPILQEAGFDYDSSVVPTRVHDRYGRLSNVDGTTAVMTLRDGFREVCISCMDFAGHGIPWGGGGYFRLVPYRLWRHGVRMILRSGRPYVFYIHPWEIDPEQPRVSGLGLERRFRHTVALDRCEARLAALCGAHRWIPVRDLLDRRSAVSAVTEDAGSARHAVHAATAPRERPHVLCIGGEDHHLRIPFLLALREKGFQTSAAGSCDPGPFTKAGIPFHRFQLDRFIDPRADAATVRALRSIIADVRPDVVHCFDTKLNVLVPLAARGNRNVGVVSTINGLGWLYSSRSPVALGLRPVYRAVQRRASCWTSAMVFQNRDDASFFARHRMVGRRKNLVIPGSGIDVEAFEAAAASGPSPAELRAALGLGSAKIVMTVARMTREKGILTLLEAAALVHERSPDIRFVLVGPRASEGRWAVSERDIERHAPYVVALGRRSDIPALLRVADVFAFPTEYREGVPRALLEAALAGLPIVTTDLPGCRDVVCDGQTGLLVPPRNPKRLAERILELVNDRSAARAMGSRAKELVRGDFDLARVVNGYAGVYDELIGGRAGDRPQDITGRLPPVTRRGPRVVLDKVHREREAL